MGGAGGGGRSDSRVETECTPPPLEQFRNRERKRNIEEEERSSDRLSLLRKPEHLDRAGQERLC